MEILNRKAKFDYEFIDKYQSGIVLLGTEIKSINAGKASIAEAFIYVNIDNEVFIRNMYISRYDQAGDNNHDERRERKLLLNKREITKIHKAVKDTGITIVPIKIYRHNGHFKLDIAVSKGKKNYDKKQSIKERDIKRDTERNG
jgi:SsrA-binding protein